MASPLSMGISSSHLLLVDMDDLSLFSNPNLIYAQYAKTQKRAWRVIVFETCNLLLYVWVTAEVMITKTSVWVIL